MTIDDFYIVGINYKKTDASIRGKFAVNQQQYSSILTKATKLNIKEIFVVSTCNRTEIYGVTSSVENIIKLLVEETNGDYELFNQLAYIKRGWPAVQHLFQVGAGLDSQIIGDYEIIGQVKKAIQFAKQFNSIAAFTERLVNSVIQCSKAIKSTTALSGGTVSVSFAAVQFLKAHVSFIKQKSIVLLGTGKIGRNTCKNLMDYLGTNNITIINRTDETAMALADELNLHFKPYNEMLSTVKKADIVIVATNADEPIIKLQHIRGCGEKVLIDLSIPNNIDVDVQQLPGITLLNVDDLSLINDKTFKKRLAEVPKANLIIAEHIEEFREWFSMRGYVPALKAARQKLMDMHTCALYHSSEQNKAAQPNAIAIQKAINNMAIKMREQQHLAGCCYIEAINDFIRASDYN